MPNPDSHPSPHSQEVRTLAIVEGHPHIITYYDSWSEASPPSAGSGGEYQHIKLELCGESLRASVRSRQALGNNELWEVMRQVREKRGQGCAGSSP